MLRIYLVRHGQNQDNADGILNGHRDEPLSAIGVAQAHELADKLLASGIQFEQVYSSPLIRALKTAQIITHTLRLPDPQVLPELIERDFGNMTGKPQSSVLELCSPDVLIADTINYFLAPEGAETFPQLLIRANALLTDLQNQYHDGNLLLVTHGDFGKMVYAAYYNLDWQDVLKQFHFGNSEMLELAADSDPAQSHIQEIEQYNS